MVNKRTRARPSAFIEPCLPSAARKPPTGGNWIHEVNLEGFRLLALRDDIRDSTHSTLASPRDRQRRARS